MIGLQQAGATVFAIKTLRIIDMCILIVLGDCMLDRLFGSISGSHMFHPVTLELDHVFHAVRAFVLNWKSPTACNTRHVRGGL